MIRFLVGMIIGLLLAGALLIGLPFLGAPTVISRLPNTSEPTEAAGVDQNLSNSIPASLRFLLTVAIGDSGATDNVTPSTDLLT
jgi:hypothetical protein